MPMTRRPPLSSARATKQHDLRAADVDGCDADPERGAVNDCVLMCPRPLRGLPSCAPARRASGAKPGCRASRKSTSSTSRASRCCGLVELGQRAPRRRPGRSPAAALDAVVELQVPAPPADADRRRRRAPLQVRRRLHDREQVGGHARRVRPDDQQQVAEVLRARAVDDDAVVVDHGDLALVLPQRERPRSSIRRPGCRAGAARR